MRKYFPDPQTFSISARSSQIVPVYRQLLADRLTPVTEDLGKDGTMRFTQLSISGNRVN